MLVMAAANKYQASEAAKAINNITKFEGKDQEALLEVILDYFTNDIREQSDEESDSEVDKVPEALEQNVQAPLEEKGANNSITVNPQCVGLKSS